LFLLSHGYASVLRVVLHRLLGIVFLGEAVGAVLGAFALDWILDRGICPPSATRKLQLSIMLVMCIAAPVVLLLHLSVLGALLVFGVYGATLSMLEGLVFKHLSDYVGSSEANGCLVNATMSVYNVFWTLGFTLGGLLSAVADPRSVLQQQLLVAGVAGVAATCGLVWNASLAPRAAARAK
jgi:hypothetical protein